MRLMQDLDLPAHLRRIGTAEKRLLDTPADLRHALCKVCGLRLGELPGLDARLATLAAARG